MSEPRTPKGKRRAPQDVTPWSEALRKEAAEGAKSHGESAYKAPEFKEDEDPFTTRNQPDSEPDNSSSSGEEETESESDSSDDEDMSQLLFYGKPDTLTDLITHCKVRFYAKPSRYEADETKSGYLASLFRGQALTWLTEALIQRPKLLEDWENFQDVLIKAFDASEQTQRQSADSRLRLLRQTGSAQKYALAFEPLINKLKYDDNAKQAAFLVGLKPQVKQQIAGQTFKTYETLRSHAINIDESLFALRTTKPKRAKAPYTSANNSKGGN
jgi:hypothetical protein